MAVRASDGDARAWPARHPHCTFARHGGSVMNPNPNQALWEKGDFTRIAATMRESGDAIVASLGITPGMKVMDLGCGDGTTALPAARRGADVLGVDIAANLVEAGNKRAQTEGLTNCRFQQGDATNLSGLADQRFDLLVSIFGAMTWGVENNVLERFSAAGVRRENVSCVKDTYVFNSPGTPAAYVADFQRYYGPTMNAFAAAEQNGKSTELQQELEALFERQNTSKVKDATSIPATFLRVTVTV